MVMDKGMMPMLMGLHRIHQCTHMVHMPVIHNILNRQDVDFSVARH